MLIFTQAFPQTPKNAKPRTFYYIKYFTLCQEIFAYRENSRHNILPLAQAGYAARRFYWKFSPRRAGVASPADAARYARRRRLFYLFIVGSGLLLIHELLAEELLEILALKLIFIKVLAVE